MCACARARVCGILFQILLVRGYFLKKLVQPILLNFYFTKR